MVFFAHLGLTTGAATLLDRKGRKEKRGAGDARIRLDYRLVLLGAVLPDLLDKPVIFLLFRASAHSGRIFAHTLIFLLALGGIGLYQYRRKGKLWALTLAGGCLAHLLLDSMWLYPVTLLWPFYDLVSSHIAGSGPAIAHAAASILQQPFGSVSVESLLGELSEPVTGICELIGFAYIAYLFVRLVRKGRLGSFVKTGRL